MKKFLTFIFASMTMFSCSNEMELMNNETKALDTETLEVSNNVTLNDIQNYMEKGSAIASRNGGNGEIEVITYQNDTVMYLLKYANGWEMMPGDKRYPLRIAYSDEGSLNYTSMSEAEQAWFEGMAEEIHQMKMYGGNYENNYCKIWNRFSQKKKNIKSRSGIEGEDNWLLHNVKEESTIKADKGHLLTTTWDQWYNEYCPPTSTGNRNCPTGCVATAVSQVLFYLHELWGVPSHMVTTPNYNPSKKEYTFSGWETYPWNNMNYNNISLLQGHVGVLSSMKYRDNGSISTLEDKAQNALSYYGINSDYKKTWDSSIIMSNLDSNIPVIGGMLTTDDQGHAIVIDGYRKIFTEYTEVYIYVEDPDSYQGDMYDHDESGDPVPGEGRTREISYNTTDIYYLFNWGTGSNPNIYYLAGMNPSYDFGGETGYINFNGAKRMLCNLRKK